MPGIKLSLAVESALGREKRARAEGPIWGSRCVVFYKPKSKCKISVQKKTKSQAPRHTLASPITRLLDCLPLCAWRRAGGSGGALCVDGIDCSGCRDDAGHRATSAGLGWQGGVGQRVTYSALERKSATSSALSLPPPHGTDASRSVAATRSASFARPLAPARG